MQSLTRAHETSKMIDRTAIEDMICELEETIIALQGRPGNDSAIEQLQSQIESLKLKLE